MRYDKQQQQKKKKRICLNININTKVTLLDIVDRLLGK